MGFIDDTSISTSAFVLLALVFTALLYSRRRPLPNSVHALQGPKNQSWLLGSWGAFLDNPSMEMTDKWTRQFGAAFKFGDFFGFDRLYISDPAALNHIFTTKPYTYPKQEVTRLRIARVLGKGLVWAEGETHRRQRRIMSYAFIRARVNDQYHVFEAVTGRLRDAISRELGSSSKAVININDIMSRATMDIILEAALDYPCNTLQNGDLEIVDVYRGFMLAAHGHQTTFFKLWNEYTTMLPESFQRLISSLPTKRYSDLRHRKQVTQAFSVKIVTDKLAEVLKGDTPTNDSIGIMIKANLAEKGSARLSTEEIVEQVSTLIQAGHDTTAATLSWLFDTLSVQQEWQTRLREAIAAFKAENPVPTMDDYENFFLLNAVLKEGIRHQVTVPYVTRVCKEDDVIPLTKPIKGRRGELISEIYVSKGTKVDGGLGDYNHSTDIWGDDAMEFLPERWLRPEGPLRTKETCPGTWGGGLITFLTSAHTCLGFRFAVLEMQMFLVEIVGNFKIKRQDKHPTFFKPNAPVVQPYCEGRVAMPLVFERL